MDKPPLDIKLTAIPPYAFNTCARTTSFLPLPITTFFFCSYIFCRLARIHGWCSSNVHRHSSYILPTATYIDETTKVLVMLLSHLRICILKKLKKLFLKQLITKSTALKTIFWNMTHCIVEDKYWRFSRTVYVTNFMIQAASCSERSVCIYRNTSHNICLHVHHN